MSISSDFLLF